MITNLTNTSLRPEEDINFAGKDWHLLKAHLHEKLEWLTSMLCGDITHDESNKIRGQILLAKTIIALEQSVRNKPTQR
jgi:hypothetical protein